VTGIVTVDPATGDELGFYPYTTPQDIDRVLEIAAASRWGRSRVEDRVAAITRLGDALREQRAQALAAGGRVIAQADAPESAPEA
jgi:acyl-CoA reductase-like NAD-dependent aldehyde dehydrogenase